ncbi:GNAT family N-acetyltransferase [Niabella beijingensis]|uniref:GNAT family N-acetyltransferase n=1 Tax=Niabella beijingensis TaxID=2872700 RepID=UPI001CBBF303|nr:GNAT family N-acetyltransferase [Niabella beijingensis]MBZ4192591.1 GNAT family N-acetyltransferase [Niabella beijingensis]
MIRIAPLTTIEGNPTEQFGHNGYTTTEIYTVTGTYTPDITGFELKKNFRKYTKTWNTTHEDISVYNSILQQGHSFAAYEANELIGWILCEHRQWNNTLYIENLLVSEKYRGRQIGKKLLAAAIDHSRMHHFRLLELETQNTNLPAIRFYRKQGFEITGFRLKLYNGADQDEVALYMTFDLASTVG